MLTSMMLTIIASTMFTSCDEQKRELRELVEDFNKECPILLDNFGTINSVSFDGETVEMKFTSNEAYAPVSSLSYHQQEVKDLICMDFTKGASRELINLIIDTGVKYRAVFIGNKTGQRAEFTIASNEMEEAMEKYSGMNDEQKLIMSMVIGTNIKLPIAVDEMTKLVGLTLTSNSLIYKYEINDRETGDDLNETINIIKHLTLSQMAQSINEKRNKLFYQALIDCHQGMEYNYHELQTGKQAVFRISTDEIKEVLNGKWNNQPTLDEWNDSGNSIDEEYDACESDTVWEDY